MMIAKNALIAKKSEECKRYETWKKIQRMQKKTSGRRCQK